MELTREKPLHASAFDVPSNALPGMAAGGTRT
jgi:hypothetical protein